MTYTGYQDIKPGHRALSTVRIGLALADRIDEATGKPMKHKALTIARDCDEKMAAIRDARLAITAGAADQLTAAGLAFADGEGTADDVVMQAVRLSTIRTQADEIARLTETATHGINARGVAALREMGDDWLATLKPAAAALIAEADDIAEQIGHEPAARASGIKRAGHPWAPDAKTLDRDIDLRHRWEKLGSILADLDELHHLADALRNYGLIGAVAGRTHAEDYRWKHPDRLAGDPAQVREFFLANRQAEAEPGIYTAADLEGTEPPHVRQLGVDSYTAATLAGAV